jgi:hypothetical protein
MQIKSLFIITTVIAIVFGVLFVIIPAQMYSLYGIESNMMLNYMGGLFGAALIAIGIISWQSRNAEDSAARRAIILGFFIADTIGFIIALIGQLNDVVNALGWLTVVIYFLLALGFAVFQFSKSVSAENLNVNPD